MRVIINCGGTRFETLLETLQAVKGSFFCSRWDQFSEGIDKEIFLDCNPAAFSMVLDYLRYVCVRLCSMRILLSLFYP